MANGNSEDFVLNLRKSVVDYENVEDAIQVEEKEAVSETIIYGKKRDDRLCKHNAQGHSGHEANFAHNIDVLLRNADLFRVIDLMLLNGLLDHDAR